MTSKAGFVALIGEPNVGKSALMNRLIGSKISIVTHKVQTTRVRVRGVINRRNTQVVFVDTPGIFAPRRRLDHAMVTAAWSSVKDADMILVLYEAHRGITPGIEQIISSLKTRNPSQRLAAVVNKIDRAKPKSLLQLAAQINSQFNFEHTFFVSATKGDGVADLLDWLTDEMPENPWFFDHDQVSDLPLRLLAAERTREKLMIRLHQEIPYQLTVEGETWEEQSDGSVRISQIIYVNRKGHKGLVLGNCGATIKAIGTAARIDLEHFLERRVHLFLRVKVRPGWLNERERYAEIGLEFQDKSS
ncbi:MAG: GTPase Era [Aestuariivita sp.]|nr:GTPase Era [Aestuariivita sp.]MCY4346575.1 GTPase Era [Aestuariivita sp.]